jgi:hypothetical protein
MIQLVKGCQMCICSTQTILQNETGNKKSITLQFFFSCGINWQTDSREWNTCFK